MTASEDEDYERQVFINCPFDARYRKMFEAITFTIFDCGFRPRSALEMDDSSQVRIDKILDIVATCKLGIHDISRTESDPKSNLPRFNMPLELGIFLGAKRYGDEKQRKKTALILDRTKYNYQRFISDLSGQDIHPHGGSPLKAIVAVRNWLRTATPGAKIPGESASTLRFKECYKELPAICDTLKLPRNRLIFVDLMWAISEWLKSNP
jgi:hypothetical protein